VGTEVNQLMKLMARSKLTWGCTSVLTAMMPDSQRHSHNLNQGRVAGDDQLEGLDQAIANFVNDNTSFVMRET
jgi:hypothetical protein